MPKEALVRGPSAFNLFVRKNKDKFKDIKEWGQKWKDLPSSKKEQFRKEAKTHQNNCNDIEKEKFLEKRLRIVLSEMQEIGIDMAAVGVSLSGEFQIFGNGHTATWLEEDVNLSGCPNAKLNEKPPKISQMRKQAQEHINQLYSFAVGKKLPFPYKKARNGTIDVEGFPEEVLPIRPMSDYGSKNLNLILQKLKKVKVKNVSPCVIDEGSLADAVTVDTDDVGSTSKVIDKGSLADAATEETDDVGSTSKETGVAQILKFKGSKSRGKKKRKEGRGIGKKIGKKRMSDDVYEVEALLKKGRKMTNLSTW